MATVTEKSPNSLTDEEGIDSELLPSEGSKINVRKPFIFTDKRKENLAKANTERKAKAAYNRSLAQKLEQAQEELLEIYQQRKDALLPKPKPTEVMSAIRVEDVVPEPKKEVEKTSTKEKVDKKRKMAATAAVDSDSSSSEEEVAPPKKVKKEKRTKHKEEKKKRRVVVLSSGSEDSEEEEVYVKKRSKHVKKFVKPPDSDDDSSGGESEEAEAQRRKSRKEARKNKNNINYSHSNERKTAIAKAPARPGQPSPSYVGKYSGAWC